MTMSVLRNVRWPTEPIETISRPDPAIRFVDLDDDGRHCLGAIRQPGVTGHYPSQTDTIVTRVIAPPTDSWRIFEVLVAHLSTLP
jgi:hypothetical protein